MRRRLLIPEVVQTSAMDCGPAALKALFGGMRIYLSYGRLRELCQTDVDGTSIDALEEVAQALGMQAEQRMLPADTVLLEASGALPAIVVVRLPDGSPHFVVLWRSLGPWVQLMDPAAGRVWVPRRRFLESLFVHEQTVAASDWQEWAQSAPFAAGLVERMAALGAAPRIWENRAQQDAALRAAGALQVAGKLRARAEVEEFLALCAAHTDQIPERFWAIRPSESVPSEVSIRGAVLVSALGLTPDFSPEALPEPLARVRSEPPPRPWSLLWGMVREVGGLPISLGLGVGGAALGAVLEALLFRTLMDPARHLVFAGQRLAALALALGFLGGLLLLKWPTTLGLLRLGRHIEVALRARFLLKVPRLEDRYFQSRLISDMASRAHSVRSVRELPAIAGELLRLAATLVITVVGIAWLYPGAAALACSAALAACVVPVLAQPLFLERDLRFREVAGSLSRFQLDALLGARAIKAHAAARALRTAHGERLEAWAAAGLRQQFLFAGIDSLQLALTLAPVLWLVYRQVQLLANPSGLLLLVYWACSIPALGSQIATLACTLPSIKNSLLRLLEPLGAMGVEPLEAPLAQSSLPVKLDLQNVSVLAGGNRVLGQLSLRVEPGEHIAIIGASGAGKSSLVGLFLGWHSVAEGTLSVDDIPLDAARLAQLRRETAWIDPQVHLFRSSLFENLRYGNESNGANMAQVFEDSDLGRILRHLPRGLQTELGDGGVLVSGGEGQRVRIGRGLARSGVRLAILDEPSRGLDYESRQAFLATARRHFAKATLFYVTHQIADTLGFSRVLVMDAGRIVEDGAPRELRERPGSRYRLMLEEEIVVRQRISSDPSWRRLRLASGRLSEMADR
ncbi:MAG: ATP-binding cassette domain-containing protein [Polyangiaceae bacterium]